MSLQEQPQTTSPRQTSLREHVLRAVLIVLCLLSTTAVVKSYQSWHEPQGRLLGILQDARVDEFNGAAIQRLQYEGTTHHAQTLTARALVHQIMNFDIESTGQPRLPIEEQLRNLETAEELARSSLAAQPNNWQAAMLLGASRYLQWSIGRDGRLFNDSAAWEEPLRRAVDIAEGKVEPRRLLVAAYLETWWALSPEKKNFARDLLAAVFRQDQAALMRLASLWLEAAGSQDEAFALIPETPFAWQVLRGHYSRGEDWTSVARVHRRWLDALQGHLTDQLEEAERRLRLGDLSGGRTLCLEVLAQAPPMRRFAPLVVEALELYPPGPHGFRSTEPLAHWLHFALRLDLLDGERLMPPAAINRLTDLVDDLEPNIRFHAALLGNDQRRLQDVSRSIQPVRAWAPFLLARARRQFAAQDPDAAMASLDQVDPLSKRQLPYAHLRHRLATTNPDSAVRSTAEQTLAPFRRRHWSALDWTGDSHIAQLFFLPARESDGLRISIVMAPDQGGVLEILLDGILIDVRAVRKKRRYEVEVPITAGLHLLETRSLGQQRILPGPVELL